MVKLLSIIIPTYNMEKYLHKCLNSLIVSKENMEALEVIVVNDGSKDLSSQIAHEYESKYPQTFKVIDKENGNYGSCINRGLKETTGKYVKVLDADDYYVTNALDKFIIYLQKKNVDLIINDFVIVDAHDRITESYTFALPINQDFTLCDIPKEMKTWLWHHGITYKTQILRSINYCQTEGIPYTDDEWVFMPMYKIESISYFPHILYHYFIGREGQTFDPMIMKTSFDKRIAVGKSMVRYFAEIENECSSMTKQFMAEKLRSRLIVIYDFYLAKEYSHEGIERLKEFDVFIKQQSLYMYNLLTLKKDRFFRKNFIYEWRTANYTCTLYLLLRQIKFRMRLLMGKKYRNLHMPDSLRRNEHFLYLTH